MQIASEAPSVGALLAYWRKARHLSQLALANEAGVSTRHVSFLETGRARPSRDMVLLLAQTLDVPLRERNALLLAAGFAPVYRETELDAPELGVVRDALSAILRQQEPYPAVVMNRRWDIARTNDAATKLFGWLLGDRGTEPANVLRLVFDPRGLRPHIANWEAVADALLARAHREMVGGLREASDALLEEILGYEGVSARFAKPHTAAVLPIVPVRFEKDGRRFSYFSTVTTLGTPLDVTLQELRIECFFPSDRETEREARAFASEGHT
jgi:transcriptional regulator with XRE-family HTH domain